MESSPLQFRKLPGFTLVELLVSMVLLSFLLLVMVSIVNQTTQAWSSTRGKIEQFRQARDAFESMTRQISQSTLNTYFDYEDSNGNRRTNAASFTASRYARQAELRFISGPELVGNAASTPPRPTHSIFFQAPLGDVNDANYTGLQNLLNTWGYYTEYADDSKLRPNHITAATVPYKKRFRLMELMQPSENMTIYKYTSGSAPTTDATGKKWFKDDAVDSTIPPVHVLAENVIALVILPKLTPKEDLTGTLLSPNYLYDTTVKKANPLINSKNQLPPVVQITMVAIDEKSANRLTDADNDKLKTKLGALFSDASKYSDDLATLEKFLTGVPTKELSVGVNYRVFTTNVSIKGAKWSRAQVN